MAKKKDGLFPVIIGLVALLVISIVFLTVYSAWMNRPLSAEEDRAQTAGVYNDGGKITKGELQDQYDSIASIYTQYYGSISGKEDNIRQQAAMGAIRQKLYPLKAVELGLDALTDEEEAKISEEVDTSYESNITSYLESYLTEEEKALDEAGQRAAAEKYMQENGFTKDFIRSQSLYALYETRLSEYVTKDITEVSDEDIQTAYDTQLANDQQYYTDAWYYELMAQSGVKPLYAPEGVRIVKHILVIPEEEVKTAYSDASTALKSAESKINSASSQIETLKAQIAATPDPAATATPAPEATPDPAATAAPTDEEKLATLETEYAEAMASIPELTKALETARENVLASVQTKLDEINAKLEAGEDFEALVAEYGEDPGMKEGLGLETGYYVAEGSYQWVEEFWTAAMALENIGDVSAPTVSSSGVHIIKYLADVTPGTVSVEDAKENLTADALNSKKSEAFETAVQGWITDYGFTIYSNILETIG